MLNQNKINSILRVKFEYPLVPIIIALVVAGCIKLVDLCGLSIVYGYMRNFLELLYFCSGIIVAVVGVAALTQITIMKQQALILKDQLMLLREQLIVMKNDMVLRSQREAAVLAAEQHLFYCDVILSCQAKYEEVSEEENIPLYSGPLYEYDETGLEKIEKSFYSPWINSSQEYNDAEIDLLNNMDAFSLYFTKGIADEEIIFHSVAGNYCKFFRHLYRMIAYNTKPGRVSHYSSAIQLYDRWSSRIQLERTKQQMKELEKSIDGLKNSQVPIIGTEK